MKNVSKVFIVFAVAVFVLTGCAGMTATGSLPKPVSVCDGLAAGDSLLCKLANENGIHLETVGNIFMFANVAAIESNAYATTDAVKFMQTAKVLLATKIKTGADLFAYVNALVKNTRLVAAGLIVISPYLPYINTPDPLMDKDREMLNSWLDQQISLLQ